MRSWPACFVCLLEEGMVGGGGKGTGVEENVQESRGSFSIGIVSLEQWRNPGC